MGQDPRDSAGQPDPTVIWEAQPRQAAFIACPADDTGFGGSRGGGKTDGIVGDFISHEDFYGQHAAAMAFRRERTQLMDMIERSKQILAPLGYKWHEQDKYWRGPKGGRLRFSYLENDNDADAYQGHNYTRLYPEEMGTFPNEAPIKKLQATLRSGNGVPCQMKGTTNPGGPGHQWVKARYKLDGIVREIIRQEYEFVNPFTQKKTLKTRVFIPSKVTDNRYLGDDYVANLHQVGSANLVRAWLQGDWSVIEGAFFDGWNIDRHVVRPFQIPANWVRIRSMDWGYAKPFSVGWWAVASDAMTLESGQVIPRGCMVRYREWYGKESANVGLRLDAEEVAAGIKRLEQGEKIDNAVLDPSAFAQNGGPSIAERMYTAHHVGFRPADNTRVASKGSISGWDAMRARLRGDDDGNPMLVCFSTCTDSIRTIPALQHDALRAEDIDTDGEDHAADEWRYGLNSRPWVRTPKTVAPGKTLQNMTLNDLWKTQKRPERRI